MERFEFDNREKAGRANSNRKNGVTTRGAIELWDTGPDLSWLDIQGPFGAKRGSVRLDKATAGKLGAALLTWAMPDNKSLRAHLGDVLAAYEAVTEANEPGRIDLSKPVIPWVKT